MTLYPGTLQCKPPVSNQQQERRMRGDRSTSTQKSIRIFGERVGGLVGQG